MQNKKRDPRAAERKAAAALRFGATTGLGLFLLAAAACSGDATPYRVTVDEQGSALRAAETQFAGLAAEAATTSELDRCGELFDGASDFVSVTGNQSTVELEASDLLAIKISGDQNSARVAIEAVTSSTTEDGEESEDDESPGFEGICFLLSGNQASATVVVRNFDLGGFAYVGRGNQPSLRLTVEEEASVTDFHVDLAGNQGSLTIDGTGSYDCPTGNLAGNLTSIVCDDD